MPSAYENIRKLNAIINRGGPLTDENRAEIAHLRIVVERQLMEAEDPASPLLPPAMLSETQPQPTQSTASLQMPFGIAERQASTHPRPDVQAD